MDLNLTDEQQMLRDTVREISNRYSTPEIVRELEDEPVGYRQDLWDQLAQLDLLGLTIPEEYGGPGQTSLETAIVYEEWGRALCMPPHLVSAIACAGVLERAASDDLKLQWLPKIGSGEAIFTLAWLEPEYGWGPDGVQATFEDGRLHGLKTRVPFASSASKLLVLARTDEGIGFYLADAAETALQPLSTMASDAEFLVEFDGVDAQLVSADGWAVWQDVLDDVLIASAAWAVGGAARAHEMAVEYANERIQFDRPIGSFQGVAHPLAEIATEVLGARTLVWEAAWTRANGRSLGPLAAMAKYYACDVFRRATKVGHQILGGIGFTLDIDMQLYFRRAKQLELTWLDPRELEERIASAELDAEVPFVSVETGGGPTGT